MESHTLLSAGVAIQVLQQTEPRLWCCAKSQIDTWGVAPRLQLIRAFGISRSFYLNSAGSLRIVSQIPHANGTLTTTQ
jgi:hypothetical protein